MESHASATRVPASRQKNCNGCVQTKRRCDRRTPVCSRCAERKIPCAYGKTRVASHAEHMEVESTPRTEVPQFGSPGAPHFDSIESLELGYFGSLPVASLPDTTCLASQPVVGPFDSGDIPMDTFMELIDNDTSTARDQWLAPLDENLVTERPGTPADEEVARTYEKMAPFCDGVQPWHLYDPKMPLHQTVNRVKGFTKEVATQNSTPFLHRYLYQSQTPQCILSCFTTCVLYDSRTPANTAMVVRALHGNVRELLDSEAGRAIATPTEKLARAQALFLYQVMRLFDENITLRSQAEKDMPVLETWLGDLCKIRENLGNLADERTRNQEPVEWERWIFAESVRRTIVMAYSVIVLYNMMKNPDDDDGPWAYVHRWTLSRPLWEASSAFEFRRLWKETPHFIIANYSFETFLEHGRAEDVDDFAEILMTVSVGKRDHSAPSSANVLGDRYMGVDETKEFISSRATQNREIC
ncbi:hypothetical protein J7T55_005622 [Diaporthe amygdali]|uniref:uncharacterized protein n=1 Tax=Phomopsis amygdali TaxID=1214568 RepID=UPI0022FF280E|nr:uncharacterized protein J7T55_005622 [Diaporthe amygdali]KAJ0124284.1 hypothetical protein J7T55_005622 [Diaporthe amygdali]